MRILSIDKIHEGQPALSSTGKVHVGTAALGGPAERSSAAPRQKPEAKSKELEARS
jgi:hypothetical protein